MTFIERLPQLKKDGSHRTKTVHHYWCVCDQCGEGTYVLGSNLKKAYGMVNGERVVTDPVPGRACRMTPKCNGKHRRTD